MGPLAPKINFETFLTLLLHYLDTNQQNLCGKLILRYKNKKTANIKHRLIGMVAYTDITYLLTAV